MDASNETTRPNVWTPLPENEVHSLEGITQVDVVIVGAGIAGLSTAYCLARAGRSVLVCDDGPIGGGQTVHTSAHLSSVIDDRFTLLQRVRGRAVARSAQQSHSAAIDFIEEVVQRESIDCQFKRVDGYLFCGPDQDPDMLDGEEKAANESGALVERVGRLPWHDFDTRVALRFPHQAEFHPINYLRGLAKAVRRLGGHIVTNVHVVSMQGGDDTKIVSHQGEVVHAKHLVVATNSPINDTLFIHTKQFPFTTYLIAMPINGEPIPHALYWDMEDPYHYLRVVNAGEASELLLVGGEDHKTGQTSDQPDRFRRLERWARERFLNLGPVAMRWSGQVMETLDGLAYIGRSPSSPPNVFMATGDSGMGLTHGTIAGMLLCDLIEGRENHWKDVYDPLRVPLRSLGRYVAENFNAVTQYADWLFSPSSAQSKIDQLEAGEGVVVSEGFRKIAVYREEDGHCMAMSAVCPHLGAVVHWDAADKCWVCPAHGSRFDCHGNVINGPANRDLVSISTPKCLAAASKTSEARPEFHWDD